MNFNEKFNKDLIQGLQDEKYLGKYLEKFYNCKVVDYNPNNNNEYDIRIIIGGKEELVELKTDRYEFYKNKITNNLFIETMCSNKVSGIKTTRSTIMAYFYPEQEKVYLIRTNLLKDFISSNAAQLKYTTGCGDGGRTSGFLINKVEYQNIFKVLDIKKLNIIRK